MLKILKELGVVFLRMVGMWIVVTSVAFFPWAVDPPTDETGATAKFYRDRYTAGAASKGATIAVSQAPLSQEEQFYSDYGRFMAKQYRIPEYVAEFARTYDLTHKRVLEVGAGSGLLQDIVDDYTGLDISPTAARFFHKPFVAASATEMPFPNDSFDGLWTIWVLEHIPNPEKALIEMRRVVKPGGYIFLLPAFDVSRYAAGGYRTRPYSDLSWAGKGLKTLSLFTESPALGLFFIPETKLARSLAAHIGGPSHLHFTRLSANYNQYWEADSDATTSVSEHEIYLWFKTRGDECVNCDPEYRQMEVGYSKLFMVIRVHKAAAPEPSSAAEGQSHSVSLP